MLDILKSLEGLKPLYRGAVFLTYTLDLLFFEELIAPKLEALGCTNVLILADQHGYDEALQRGERHLRRVGRQYVCTPVIGAGSGVQHAKAMMLAGPRHGWMLMGSGNLTLHGVGRNLEQFVQFDLDIEQHGPEATGQYPFHTVWNLVNTLVQDMGLSSTTGDRLQAIGELAPWLDQETEAPPGVRVWHSYERPILEQWQGSSPQDELRLLSPFWSIATIDEMVHRLKPQRLILGLNDSEYRIDGPALQRLAEGWSCAVELNGVSGEPDGLRRLHAKTYTGSNKDSSWCITGSANCTEYGLQRSWLGGGNLELVVWQDSTDPDGFRGIWSNEDLRVRTLDLAKIGETTSVEPRPERPHVRISELRYDPPNLHGRMEKTATEPEQDGQWWLELKRSAWQAPIVLDSEGSFQCFFGDSLNGTEAGRVIFKHDEQVLLVSPFHWVDQPHELGRYGNRTYHTQVRAKLQTFSGTGQLFEELLNFLWERVDPREINKQRQEGKIPGKGRARQRSEASAETSIENPPPVSSFITDEQLTNELFWHVEGYAPYNQSTYSLRDLLSITLLRLTVETQPEDAPDYDDGSEENTDEVRHDELLKNERKEVLQQLCDYLIGYCRKYAKRLADPDFLKQIGPQLLFENHFTLGRVLLEFYEKVQLFSDKDLRTCVAQILGALFWPPGIGQHTDSGWELLLQSGYQESEILNAFRDASLPELIVILVAEAWGEPRPWEQTRYQTNLVQRYLYGKELLAHIVRATGKSVWKSLSRDGKTVTDIYGLRNISDLDRPDEAISIEVEWKQFYSLCNYKTPAEERYHDLFLWDEARQKGYQSHPQVKELEGKLLRDPEYRQKIGTLNGPGRGGKLQRLVGVDQSCPTCYIRLPLTKKSELEQYDLVICPNCSRAVLYWMPSLPSEVI